MHYACSHSAYSYSTHTVTIFLNILHEVTTSIECTTYSQLAGLGIKLNAETGTRIPTLIMIFFIRHLGLTTSTAERPTTVDIKKKK